MEPKYEMFDSKCDEDELDSSNQIMVEISYFEDKISSSQISSHKLSCAEREANLHPTERFLSSTNLKKKREYEIVAELNSVDNVKALQPQESLACWNGASLCEEEVTERFFPAIKKEDYRKENSGTNIPNALTSDEEFSDFKQQSMKKLFQLILILCYMKFIYALRRFWVLKILVKIVVLSVLVISMI